MSQNISKRTLPKINKERFCPLFKQVNLLTNKN